MSPSVGYFWRDPVTDPPSEDEYGDGTQVAVRLRCDGEMFDISWARRVRENPEWYIGWFPLPSERPDPPVSTPKRCVYCGAPAQVRAPMLCGANHSRDGIWAMCFIPRPDAAVSLVKRPDPPLSDDEWNAYADALGINRHPDPPVSTPKRCQCGAPAVPNDEVPFVCVVDHAFDGGRAVPCSFFARPDATVSLVKRPDRKRTVGWWPMELLADGHEFEVAFCDKDGNPLFPIGGWRLTARRHDGLYGRHRWCPLAPLLALIPEEDR
jgi:hypothetical protein